jgi:hypothetical protein
MVSRCVTPGLSHTCACAVVLSIGVQVTCASRAADVAGSNGRGNARYKRDNARLKATLPPVCRWCGEAIDRALVYPNPMSWSADHVVPMAQGGDLYGERVPMHLRCNDARGLGPLPPEPVDLFTEAW